MQLEKIKQDSTNYKQQSRFEVLGLKIDEASLETRKGDRLTESDRLVMTKILEEKIPKKINEITKNSYPDPTQIIKIIAKAVDQAIYQKSSKELSEKLNELLELNLLKLLQDLPFEPNALKLCEYVPLKIRKEFVENLKFNIVDSAVTNAYQNRFIELIERKLGADIFDEVKSKINAPIPEKLNEYLIKNTALFIKYAADRALDSTSNDDGIVFFGKGNSIDYVESLVRENLLKNLADADGKIIKLTLFEVVEKDDRQVALDMLALLNSNPGLKPLINSKLEESLSYYYADMVYNPNIYFGLKGNCYNYNGRTLLMLAKSYLVAKELLKLGANVNERISSNPHSPTVLMENQNLSVLIAAIESSNPDFRLRTFNGKTAYTIAKKNGNDEFAALLKSLRS